MPNIISFQRPRSTRVPDPEPGSGLPTFGPLVAELRSKAKREIHVSILALDLAAQHARQIVLKLRDPAVKAGFEAQIAIIERLLQIARDKTMKL